MGKKKKKSKSGISRKLKKINKSIKYIGLICACFTAVQAIIWIILTLMGIYCFFGYCGRGTVNVSFSGIYHFDFANLLTGPSYVAPPLVFILILIFYLILSIAWLYVSCYLIVVFRKWLEYKEIKLAARRWITVTAIVCVADLILFLLFLVDATCIYKEYMNEAGQSRQMLAEDYYSYINEPYGADLVNAVQAQRERIKKIKEDVNSINSTMENKTVNNILNPFLQKKIWEKVHWPTKLKSKEQNFTFYTTPKVRIKRTEVANLGNKIFESLKPHQKTKDLKKHHPKTLKSDNENPDEKTPDVPNPEKNATQIGPFRPLLPPVICMTVAIRGLIAWIANIVLLLYFRHKVKQLREKKSIINWIRKCFKRKQSKKNKSTKRKSSKKKSQKKK